MNNEILLSLCIPTNGVTEWVHPVLDSIYAEKEPIGNFEVIVTDNGDNKEFQEFMEEYCKRHDNLIYKKTDAKQFYNQIEAFKLASGKLIKFINHRMTLLPGALNYLIKFTIDHEEEKPFVCFLDNECAGEYSNFNDFVRGLSYWSSYSGGLAVWKEDFEKVDLTIPFNSLFPHINLLFSQKEKTKYIIDGKSILKSLPTDETKKGKYNLFYAFAVEYPAIILDLYRNGDITYNTFLKVKKDNYKFVSGLYFDYVIRKKPCSYDLSDAKYNLNVFYGNSILSFQIFVILLKKVARKITRR